MPLRFRWSYLLALAALALAVVAGVALWPRLPAEIAVHFDASGTPDNYVSKPVGVLLAPAIGLVAVGIVRYAERADPTADPRVLAVSVVFVGGLIAYVQGLVLAYNLGNAFSMTTALAPVFVAAAALVGYALYREGVP
ncbi:DUF1648 domain-containing protein [Natronomonas salina]|uniref:DUF1648 domain-containing protein n=1 Tax=Natronomonas salina TaxID=1710540 RepID=UPI0015B534BE|nr:DUF1648 domain-containing protein [Natronomonas salina]QLD89976.1 DUF1648 domain-containing protein [Natronomonas salina]